MDSKVVPISSAKNVSKTRIKGPFIVVRPDVAARIGLNEAIALQHLLFRMQTLAFTRGGERYCQINMEGWQKEFPFWSKNTIRRTFESLEAQELVRSVRTRDGKFFGADPQAAETEQLPKMGTVTSQNGNLFFIEKEGFKNWQPVPGCGNLEGGSGNSEDEMKTAKDALKLLDSTSSIDAVKARWQKVPVPKSSQLGQAWLEMVGLCRRLQDDNAKLPPPLTNKQIGQLGQIAKRLSPAEAMLLILEGVPRWGELVGYVRLQAGLEQGPQKPHVGFLLTYCSDALDWLEKPAGEEMAAPKPVSLPTISPKTEEKVTLEEFEALFEEKSDA